MTCDIRIMILSLFKMHIVLGNILTLISYSLLKSGLRKYFIPVMAPGRVNPLMIRIMRKTYGMVAVTYITLPLDLIPENINNCDIYKRVYKIEIIIRL